MARIPGPAKIQEPEIQIDLVHGRMPDSKNEYFVALALDKLGYEYLFQKVLGMAGVRGSQVIDFLVFVGASPKAVFVQGEYWHNRKTESEDTLKHAIAAQVYGAGNVVDLMGEETDTPEKALKAVKAKL